MLRKVKKKIENEFLEATTRANKIEGNTEEVKQVKAVKTKKAIVKDDKKAPKIIKKEKTESKTKKESQTKKKSSKK